MRCPECSQRNSVAAKNCYSCGHKFKRKPLPVSLKVFFGVFALLVVVWGAAAAFAPSFTDPKNSLARIAKRVAAGPKSEADAKEIKSEFDESVRNFLKQNGTQPSLQLSKSLQQALADAAFEVHVFDLPRGLTVVEIDTILQASDYLILKSGANLKVTPIVGMEVFDSAKILTDQAPVVVLLGHTGGQGAHRPLVRVLALLPDDVVDQTAKSVPELKTEGSASFARNGRDVNIDYSILSLGVNEHVFSPSIKLPQGLPDETIHGTLKWSNGHYEPQTNGAASGQLSLLYAAAKVLSGAPAAQYEKVLGKFATALATKPGDSVVQQEFTITPSPLPPVKASRKRREKSIAAAASYLMQGKTVAYAIDLSRAGDWAMLDARKAELSTQPAAAVAVTPAPEKEQSTDNKIITATPKTPTPSTTVETVENLTTKAPTQESTPVPATALVPTSKTDKTDKADKNKQAAQEKLTMTQPKSKVDTTVNTTPPATQEPAKETPEPAKGNSEGAVGIGASVSDKIEVSQIKMRSGPGTNYKQLSTLQRGAKIKVIGKTSGWYKVRVNGKDGYVYGGFVDYKTPDAYETLTVQKAEQLTDDHAKKIGESKPGERLVVLGGSKDGKVRVQLSSGQTAYINKESVDKQEDVPQFVP